MKNGKFQVKDIPDWVITECIERVLRSEQHAGAIIWDMEMELPFLHPNLLRAKCLKMIKQGKIEGCCCGCRGDFKIVERES